MSETKHTRGPWTAEYGENSGYDCMTPAWLIFAEPRYCIADVDLSSYGASAQRATTPERASEAAATARLIAAAPDMLDALKAIEESCPTDSDVTESFNAAWQLLKAAIAKAEGEP